MEVPNSEFETLKKGDDAPNFVLWGVDEVYHSLDEVKGAKGTLIIFMANNCPTVISYLEEIKRITNEFKSRGVNVVGINSNDSITSNEDSFTKMLEYFKAWDIDFCYLHDDAQTAVKSYGASCTPDPFFFDGDLKLVFHSRLDGDRTVNQESENKGMYEAIDEFLKIGTISLSEKSPVGSGIKWRYDEM
jgi:peroxiredoxin